MIITIEGGPGKTSLARSITENKKTCYIEEHHLRSWWWTSKIDGDLDFIVVDNVLDVTYNETLSKFQYDFLTIHKQCEEPFEIKMPNIILIKI